jgi:hypothetical protein
MVQKVFVSLEGMATFVCPKCEKLIRTDVSKYGQLKLAVRLRAKCACGYSYSVDLERRQYCRAAVNLPGVVWRIVERKKTDRTLMVVTDLSRVGIKLRVGRTELFKPDDAIYVEFMLNDISRSTIRKEAVVRAASGLGVRAEFTSVDSGDASDKALAFYFISCG